MFSYKKVDVLEVLKIAPKETYRDVYVVGEIFDDIEEYEVDTHYFLIEDTIIHDEEGVHEYSGYMKAYFPSRLLNDMYLYLVKSSIKNYEMFFIAPDVYENTTNEGLELLLLNTIDNIKEDKSEDLLEKYYLNECIFYEITSKNKDNKKHSFMSKKTFDLTFKEISNLTKNYIYRLHKEPLTYNINDSELIFISTENLRKETIYLLELNNKGLLSLKKELHIDNVYNYFEKQNYSVRNLMSIYNVLKEIENLNIYKN